MMKQKWRGFCRFCHRHDLGIIIFICVIPIIFLAFEEDVREKFFADARRFAGTLVSDCVQKVEAAAKLVRNGADVPLRPME